MSKLAFKKLQEGNTRYRSTDVVYTAQQTAQLRDQLKTGQSPHTAILSCADSRVPVELIFAQDIGEVFVVRVAGNVADTVEIASIEFSVAVLGVEQILVMGHTSCGAVAATVDYVAAGQEPGSDALLGLVRKIEPAVKVVCGHGGDLDRHEMIDEAIKENVRQVAEHLQSSSRIIKKAVADGKLAIRGAVYDLAEGRVNYLD